ncbi:hypothetical protein I7I50_08116 [Histoplasma capsulatum G186AR]|uniref:Uncharacterized protein n=1 Tax=Ajellomyces capsulatus TaxID=5037 RepID=A0A8H7YHH3_AJECA|nr:hypothetical protein I7I52_08632 [Histoplasma capsulatum]QSS68639.1 hypothetical protein I7I50_08116 [Histoplasma capsulatum G186AR]
MLLARIGGDGSSVQRSEEAGFLYVGRPCKIPGKILLYYLGTTDEIHDYFIFQTANKYSALSNGQSTRLGQKEKSTQAESELAN